MRHEEGPDGAASGFGARRGPTGDDRAVVASRIACRVSPQCAAERKSFGSLRHGGDMAMADGAEGHRGLPGATVLQILPALAETPAARAAVDRAVALLRSGARVIVAAEDGPLNSELQGLGGEWVRLVTDSDQSAQRRRATRAPSPTWSRTERVDLVHAVGVGASRSAATLKKRAGVWLVHSYATDDLKRPTRDKSYSRALARRRPRDRAVALRGGPGRGAPSGAARKARGHSAADRRRALRSAGDQPGARHGAAARLEDRARPAHDPGAGTHRSRQGPAHPGRGRAHPHQWRPARRRVRAGRRQPRALRLRQEDRRAGRGARRRASDPSDRRLFRHGGRVSGDRLRRGAADRAAGVSACRRGSDGDGRAR